MSKQVEKRETPDQLIDGTYTTMTTGSIGPQQRDQDPADSEQQEKLSEEWKNCITDSLRHGDDREGTE
jgi:hypothetical protein